jgi:hypothetical protein
MVIVGWGMGGLLHYVWIQLIGLPFFEYTTGPTGQILLSTSIWTWTVALTLLVVGQITSYFLFRKFISNT